MNNNPVALLRSINDHGQIYKAIVIWCPGCEVEDVNGQRYGGLHMLAVTGARTKKRPVWKWNGDLVSVTLSPSILTRTSHRKRHGFVCHSFLRNGIWQYLNDCTHQYKSLEVPLPPLPDWVVR